MNRRSLIVPLLAWLIPVTVLGAHPRLDESPATPDQWGYRPADAATSATNPPSFSWRPQRGIARWEIEVWTPGSIPPDIGDRKVHRCWHLRARG